MKSSWQLSQSRKKGLWILFLILTLIIVSRWWILVQHPYRPPIPQPPQNWLVKKMVSLDTLEVNSATAEDFQQFRGIGKVLSNRIIKFRESKGGFRSITEVGKVYGVADSTFTSMMPFLTLSVLRKENNSTQKMDNRLKKSATASPIDINLADSASWASLPGIGPVLSQRILKFRKLKGGFSRKEALKDVYGLSQETYEVILPYLLLGNRDTLEGEGLVENLPVISSKIKEEGVTRGISEGLIPVDVNVADSSQLEALPGIGPTLAKRIISYRKIIGFYSQLDFLKRVYGLTEDHYNPSVPYLYVNELPPPKEDINMISIKKLTYFPFVDKNTLEKFGRVRKQKGRFLDWEEFQLSMEISSQELALWKTYFLL